MHRFYLASALCGLMAVPLSASLPEFNASMTQPHQESAKDLLKRASSLASQSLTESDPARKATLLAQLADLYGQIAQDPEFIGHHTSIIISAAHIYVRAAQASPGADQKKQYFNNSLPYWRELLDKGEISDIDAPMAIQAFEAAGDAEMVKKIQTSHPHP